MRKSYGRIISALLSASMLISLCMPIATAMTADETPDIPTNYVEVEPELVTYEAPEEEPDEAPEQVDVTIDPDGNVSVGERPEATPDEPEVEWKGEGENEDGSIKAEVEGSETYTPSETVKDDEDRVTEEGGETKGEETIGTEITEPEKKDPDGTDGTEDKVSDKVGSDETGTDVSVDLSKGETGDSESWGLTKDDLLGMVEKPALPDGYQADGTYTESSEDGSTTTTKNWVCEDYTHTETTDDGTTVDKGYGYKVTETVTTTKTEKIDPDLSERPENAEDMTGEDGLAGYRYTEVSVDENGVRTETTYTVYPEQGICTTTTTTITTKLTYAEQKEEGKAEISDVTVEEGEHHGDLSKLEGTTLDPNIKIPGDLEVDADTGLRGYYEGYKQLLSDAQIGNGDFVWNVGQDGNDPDAGTLYGSIYGINTEFDIGANAKLYVVKDKDGKEYYVYCADHGQGFERDEDGNYTGSSYTMENLKDEGFFGDDKWKAVEEIAVNGFWGTASGMGSLDEFKKMLIAGGMDESTVNECFNEGMALTVTQAAIWKYSSSLGNYTTDKETFTTIDKATGGSPWLKTETLSEAEQKLLQDAYEILLRKAKSSSGTTTDLIDEKDITNIEVAVKGKNEDDTYNTELSFTLDIQPDRLNSDDLKVTVKLSNGSEYTYLLKDAAKDDELTNIEANKTDNDITYILKGITMPDGTKVSINLSGTQSLGKDGKGAYLLVAQNGYDKSQSFVGIFEGEREVDLSISLDFRATQPVATITTDTTEQVVTEQTQQTGWVSSWLKKIFYPKEPEDTEEIVSPEEPDSTEKNETTTVEPEPTEKTETAVEPETTLNPETPEKPENTGDMGDAVTPAPEMDSVPKTGDDMPVWAVLSVLSAAGILLLNLPQKKTKH